MSIPLISLADASPAALARAISDACQSAGFLYVTDHGISQADIDSAFAFSSGFFEDEVEAEKERVRARGINIGVRAQLPASSLSRALRWTPVADPGPTDRPAPVDDAAAGDARPVAGQEGRPARELLRLQVRSGQEGRAAAATDAGGEGAGPGRLLRGAPLLVPVCLLV